MKVLVINCGSSSLKYQLIEMETEKALAKGTVDRVGQKVSTISHTGKSVYKNNSIKIPTHTEAVKAVLDALVSPQHGVLESIDEIGAVGHRVVHGGEEFTKSVLINKETMDGIKKNIDLAPLHQPANIIGIEACERVIKNKPQVAVFDTTFHSTIPAYAYMYAINYDDYKKYRIRRYGFHGTSHAFVASEALKVMPSAKKIIVCHLGNGASISAVKDGKCIDTSMGLTPLEGLIMGTRCGDIDAAVVQFLCEKTNKKSREVTDYLNKSCGVLGVSGVSSDFRDLHQEAENGNERAKLALYMFAYRVKKYIGSYAAALGGLDLIAFTGGIGEHNPTVRANILEGLEFLGAKLDSNKNNSAPRGEIALISNSKTNCYIIPTNEELVIARETKILAE